MKTVLREKNLEILIMFFFIFGVLFPTLRILTIGSQTSQNKLEYIFSVLPELISTIILLFGAFLFYKNKVVIKLNYFDYVLIGFTITNVLLGVILARDLLLSVYGFRMSYFPVFFYFIFRFGNIEFMLSLLNKIFIWFLIIGVIGIILYFGFFNQMVFMIKQTGPIIGTAFEHVRMTSIIWTPVVFSTFMFTAFIYFYHKFLLTQKWYLYVVLSLLWCCILLSVTRGGFVVLIFGYIFISIIQKKWWPSIQVLILLFLIFIIIGYYISTPLSFLSWILGSVSDTVGLKSDMTRVGLWLKAFEDFKIRPFGFGLGKAGHVAHRFLEHKTQDAAVYSTDGWYLKLANETGIWGLFSYFILAIYFFVICIKNILTRKTEYIYVWLFTIFLMVNIQNIVSNVLDFYMFSYFYWGIVGLTINIIQNKIRIA